MSQFQYHMTVAVVAAMLNALLSVLVPPLLKKADRVPLSDRVVQYYECNRKFIMVSTLLVLLFVFVSLEITPWVNANVFNRLAQLAPRSNAV